MGERPVLSGRGKKRRPLVGTLAIKVLGTMLSLFLALMFLSPTFALASSFAQDKDTSNPILGDTLDDLTDSGATKPMEDVYKEIFGERVTWRDVVSQVLSGKGLDLKLFFRAMSETFWGEISRQMKVLGKIMLLGLVIACLRILGETIAKDGVGKTALWASHIALIVLCVLTFKDVFHIASSAVESLRSALFAFVPSITALLLTQGAPASAGVLYPLIFSAGSLVSIFLLDVAFPLIYTSLALELAGSLVGSDRVSFISDILKQVAFIGTGLVMASFVGIVIGQRAASGVADGVALRTAKYVSSTFIPIAGKMVGDTMDMFFFAIKGLRTALGLAGSIAILAVMFNPLMKLLTCLFAWKIAYSLLGPITGKEVARSLKSMADGITVLTMSIFVASFTFVICLSLLAAAVRT